MVEEDNQEQRIVFSGRENNALVGTHFIPVSLRENAPPVLFMHGGGQTRHSWNMGARFMAQKGLHALSFDARGHGDSAWVETEHYTFGHYSADLAALAGHIKQEFGQSPIVVGASMGGISAMLAQHEYGKALFRAIILVDITHRMQLEGINKIMGFMVQNIHEGFDSVEAAADVIAAYLPHRKRPENNEGLAKNLRKRQDGRYYWHWDPHFITGKNNISIGYDDYLVQLRQAVRSIAVPTLLICGQKSELIHKADVDDFMNLVPHAHYKDIRDAGHMVVGDKNDAFSQTVVEFVENHVLVS